MDMIKRTINSIANRLGCRIVKKRELDAGKGLVDGDTPKVLLGTYHKTGTSWLRAMFMEIASRTGRQWLNLSDSYTGDAKGMLARMEAAPPGALIFEYHTAFPKTEPSSAYRGLRMIRDPRDVVLSSVRFHRKATETWLHEPRPEFDGKTYQERINEIQDPLEAFQFELDHAAGREIHNMVNFANLALFRTVKYEDMITDIHMKKWLEVFVDLGFDGAELPACLSAVWNHSIFGKKEKDGAHVLDGSVSQWRKQCSTEMLQAFYDMFPDAPERLGYIA